MNTFSKISIIVPLYNVELYIERCLLSVIRQTYHGPMECLIIDDCGDDNSIAIAERIIAAYEGPIEFHILHHDHNRGLSAARNTGTEAATGDYIYYLDSDDVLLPDSINLLEAQVELHPNIQCVQGTMVSTIGYSDISIFAENQYVNDNNWIRRNFYGIHEKIPVNAWNKLLNRNFLLNNKLFFKEGILHEDRHWMFFLVKYLESIAFVFDPTYIYYRHESSIMATSTLERTARYYKIIIKDWLEHCDVISLSLQLQTILSQYANHCIYLASSHDENTEFVRKLSFLLWKEKQYKSVCYLYLWKLLQPIHNFRKLLKYAYEDIITY